MNKLPENVREGMDVYDRDNHHLGKVESLRFGDEAVASGESRAGVREETLVDNLAEALSPQDMPEAERAILLSEGYLVLDTKGLFSSDRFIRPGQIESVSSDRVVLNVTRDGLVKA